MQNHKEQFWRHRYAANEICFLVSCVVSQGYFVFFLNILNFGIIEE